MKTILFLVLLTMIPFGYAVEVETPCEANDDEKVQTLEEVVSLPSAEEIRGTAIEQ